MLVFGSNKNDNNTKTEFNWEPIIEAIIHVESKGDPNAKSGNSVGVLQITPSFSCRMQQYHEDA